MKSKIVVIASTVEEGRDVYPSAAAIVTPRASDAADGIAADRVIVMGSMREHEKLDELRAGITMSHTTTARERTVQTAGRAVGVGFHARDPRAEQD